ncbi:MAG: 2-C-methyl-D-erythritol 4-phosphate cytidylyltransferase [Rhodothermales bacterium]|nr:2-C-methyl-D-erythritol 4-phosphate cytidylyltransferase [Rhodothermales bacterium]
MATGETVAVVPAAGGGRRMGGAPGEPPKQLRRLGDAPVVVQSLRALARHAAVSALVVVGPAGDTADLEAALRRHPLGKPVRVVEGGPTRQASVGRGLAALPASADIVLVHDAVRPFLPYDALERVIGAVREHGAAALAIPVADTVRRADGGAFGETVPREGLWRMQTPQAFRADLLREAHAQLGDVTGTDEVELVRRLGHPVRLVRGSALNLKLTTPTDWALAEALWPVWRSGSVEGREEPEN